MLLRNTALTLACMLMLLIVITPRLPGMFPHPPQPTPAILILGFRDLSKSAGTNWISKSVADWLASDLKADDGLRVMEGVNSPVLRARSNDSGCAGLPTNVRDAARLSFNADMAVYGDYLVPNRGTSDQWRLDICLQQVNGQEQPETITVLGPNGDISQMVFNAGALIRSKIGVKQITSASMGYLRATLPSSLAAARLYAEGTSALEDSRPEEARVLLTEATRLEPDHPATHAALSAAWSELGYQKKSLEEALTARNLVNSLPTFQQLEYDGLVSETASDWQQAARIYGRLAEFYPDNSNYVLKLANALTRASQTSMALQVLAAYRTKTRAAGNDPRIDLAEASAQASIGNYRSQLSAANMADREAAAGGADLLLADARMQEGDANDKLDNWTEASRLWRLAGQTYEAIDNKKGMASELMDQGDLAWRHDDAIGASKLFEQALMISKTSGDQSGVADAVSHLGVLRLYTTAVKSAVAGSATDLFGKAEAIYKQTGDVAGEGNVLSLFGDEALMRCQYRQAKEYYTKGLQLSTAAGDQSRIANRLLDIGIAAESEGRLSEAEQYFNRSLYQYQNLGQQDRAAVVKERIGEVLFRKGRVDEAAQTFEDSLAELHSIGRTMQVLQVRGQLVWLEILRNPVRAEALAQEDVQEAQPTSKTDPNGMAGLYAQLAHAEAETGKLKEARDALRRSVAYGQRGMHQDFWPQVLLDRGYVCMRGHDYSSALEQFRRSKEMAHREHQAYWELNARVAIGETEVLQQGRAALPGLAHLKTEADNSGFGILGIEIGLFLKTARL